MIANLDYLERTVLETWGGTINDLENTSYWHLLDVLNAKDPDEIKKQKQEQEVPNAFEFFQNHSINDI